MDIIGLSAFAGAGLFSIESKDIQAVRNAFKINLDKNKGEYIVDFESLFYVAEHVHFDKPKS
jgi:hypothetical protein